MAELQFDPSHRQRVTPVPITAEEHAKITSSFDPTGSQPPAPNAQKGDFEGKRSDLNKAWMLLGSGIIIALCIKVAVDKVVASGEPVRWGLVYTIYAVCALAVLGGIGGIMESRKK